LRGIFDTPDDLLKAVVEINLLGTIRVNSVFNSYIKQNKGVYVQLSSILGLVGQGGVVPYCSTKHGLEGYSKCLRMEMEPYGIRVLCIEPGWVATPMVQNGILNKKVADSETQKLVYPLAVPTERLEATKSAITQQIITPDIVATEIFRATFTSKLSNYHMMIAPPLAKALYLLFAILPIEVLSRAQKILLRLSDFF